MDREELTQEIVAVSDYVAALIRPFEDTNIPIKNSKWTIGTAAAHLVLSQKIAKKVLQGDENPYKNAKPETVAQTNAALLEEFTERQGSKLATMLVMHTEALLKEFEKYGDSDNVKTHFGKMDVLLCLSYNLCHLLIHGCQIANALKKPLPIEEKHVEMVLPFLKRAMEVTYDKAAAKDFHGTFVIHLWGFTRYAVICKEDQIEVTEIIPDEIDCHIFADPRSFFLVSNGITNQWSELAKGKIIIWGRRPWLALRLPKLFKSP